MSATLHNRNVGPFLVSVGLRADGGRSVEFKSDILKDGCVVAALITPGPIVVVFHQPTLDALAAQLDADEEARLAADAGRRLPVDLDLDA